MREQPLILIVEDNPASLEIMQVRLEASDYRVITATDGEEGLAKAQSSLPDLILLDVMMPKMDGLEVCRRLKNNDRLPFMPIIMVTAKTDTKDVIAGLEAGGDEYLTKPVDHGSLVARVKSMLRIKELHDTVIAQSTQLENQLKTASKIQTLFWPELPTPEGGIRTWAVSQPASYVGGDFYDAIILPDKSVLAYVADVSGKGVPAALIMAAVSTKIRAEASLQQNLNLILRAVNGSMYELASTEGYFATVLLLKYWPRMRKIEMIRAGHINPVLVSPTGVREISGLKGVSLGVMEEVDYELAELVLEPGESLLLFSDGVTEAENASVEQFGYQRLIDQLSTSKSFPHGEGLLESVREWRGQAVVNDDLTIFEIGCDPD
ncbi:PP2C family protein-serine/threonine phosphatase [Thermodesulfobacteriota bacterium]